MHRAILGALILAFGVAHGADERPTGLNCNLAAPPETAGEEINHGIVLRVYPRVLHMPKDYTGCQIMWMPEGTKWHALSVVVIEKGDPVRIWAPDGGFEEGCRFKNGRLVKGRPDKCPAPQYLIAKSLAPGCIERITKADGKWPPDCKYE